MRVTDLQQTDYFLLLSGVSASLCWYARANCSNLHEDIKTQHPKSKVRTPWVCTARVKTRKAGPSQLNTWHVSLWMNKCFYLFASNAIRQCGRTHRTKLRRLREPNKQRQIARQSQVPSVLFAQHTRFPQPQSVPKALRLCATHNAQDVDTGQALSDREKDKGKEKIGKKKLKWSE